MQLRTRVEIIGTLPVLTLAGEIDLATLPRLHDAIVQLVDEHPGVTVAVDLDAVESLDDAGLGIVLGGAARARDHGGELVLVCTGPRLRERLRVTRFDRAVTVHPTITAAATHRT